MNMLDQPDNICSLLSNDNREPDYNVKTRDPPGAGGPWPSNVRLLCR